VGGHPGGFEPSLDPSLESGSSRVSEDPLEDGGVGGLFVDRTLEEAIDDVVVEVDEAKVSDVFAQLDAGGILDGASFAVRAG
jgi:hypothetical protein